MFLFACVPGLIMGALMLLIPEPPRGGADSLQGKPIPIPQDLQTSAYRAVLGIRTMWWIIASGALHNFNMYAINAFQTPFLQRFHELSLREANSISAVVLGAVGVVGLLVGGWASDRLRERFINGRILLTAVTMLLAAPCVYLAIGRPSGALVSFTILMGLGIMMTFVYYATIYASIQDVVDPSVRGTAVALYFFAMYVLGASLGPVAIGMLSDHFAVRAMHAAGAVEMAPAFKATGLHDAMYVIPVLMLLASLVLFAAARTIGADIRRRETK